MELMYTNGTPVPRDYQEAVKWCYKAAKQGNEKAQVKLGLMHYYGDGESVPRDYIEAEKWFQRAAKQGNEKAQVKLGLMYENGEGIPHDYQIATKWFRKAAEKGFNAQSHFIAEAQYRLGTMYLKGIGVPRDYVLAYMWFNLAATIPPKIGYFLSAECRDKLEEKMTLEQIAEAQRLSREWKPKGKNE